MTVADVREWAEKTVGLDAEDASILAKQKIDGEQLLKVIQLDLERWRMPGGPAGKLVDAVAKIISKSLVGEMGERE